MLTDLWHDCSEPLKLLRECTVVEEIRVSHWLAPLRRWPTIPTLGRATALPCNRRSFMSGVALSWVRRRGHVGGSNSLRHFDDAQLNLPSSAH